MMTGPSPAAPQTVVTPVILTFNEEPNIGRTLDSLRWAGEVVVVDSGSTDRTREIAAGYANVRWLERSFDTHGRQWTYAIKDTGIASRYVLALDADYVVPAAFVNELQSRFGSGTYAGGIAGFDYHVLGRNLLSSVYPAKLVLFDRERVVITQPGHSQELHVDGPLYHFEARLVHDDRKPVSRFVRSQIEYSRLEAERLLEGRTTRWQDTLRRSGLMPVFAGLLAYARAGGPLRGRAALRYAYERATFESLLAMRLLASDAAGDTPTLASEAREQSDAR